MDIKHEVKSLKRMRDQIACALMLSGKGTTEMIDTVTRRLYGLHGVVDVAGLGDELWNIVESVSKRLDQERIEHAATLRLPIDEAWNAAFTEYFDREGWTVTAQQRVMVERWPAQAPRVASCVTRTLLELIDAYAKADARSPLNPDAAALRAELVTRLDRIRDYADEPSGRVVRQQLDGTS